MQPTLPLLPLHWINNLPDPAGNFRASFCWFIGLVIIMTVVLTRTRYGNWTKPWRPNAGDYL